MTGYIKRSRTSDIIGCSILKPVFIYRTKVTENKLCTGHRHVQVSRNPCPDERSELNLASIVFRSPNRTLKYEIYLCRLNNLSCLLMAPVRNLPIAAVVSSADDSDTIFERWPVGQSLHLIDEFEIVVFLHISRLHHKRMASDSKVANSKNF